jgi:2-oxoglutarate ferredoxin oxidoreductase subunit beta
MSDRLPDRKLFASEGRVKWCPGCGDYAVLKQVQLVLAETGIDPDAVVMVSGIGCSGRFSYYMETYGVHSMHGRALPMATGIKCQNPALDVWAIMGDGDCLSIGTNHFVHSCRRNLDMVALILDNQIYGLTKGQASPTTAAGEHTKSTPAGVIETPINPVRLALAAGATFVARCLATDQPLLKSLLTQAHQHQGFSVVHILQPCQIFNPHGFDDLTGPDKGEHQLLLQAGKPMIFGRQADKAIQFDKGRLQVVSADTDDLVCFDPRDPYSCLPDAVAAMPDRSQAPLPTGVFRQVEAPCYEDQLSAQISSVRTQGQTAPDVQLLLNGSDSWTN